MGLRRSQIIEIPQRPDPLDRSLGLHFDPRLLGYSRQQLALGERTPREQFNGVFEQRLWPQLLDLRRIHPPSILRRMPIRVATLLLAGLLSASAQAPEVESVAPFYPTPMPIVRQMLEEGNLHPASSTTTSGAATADSSSSPLATSAHARSATRSTKSWSRAAAKQIEELGLSELASIRQEDLYKADFTQVDLVTTYLLPRALALLRPHLEKQLKKGARVVSHDFYIEGWNPTRPSPSTTKSKKTAYCTASTSTAADLRPC